jgi:hypothetical protein
MEKPETHKNGEVKLNVDVRESVHRDIIMKLRFNSSMTPAGSDLGEYYQML